MDKDLELQMFKCQRCGKCVATCPVVSVLEWESFSPRSRILLSLAKTLGDIKESRRFSQIIFSCTTCKLCEEVCPAGVRVVDIVLATREQLLAESGAGMGHVGKD